MRTSLPIAYSYIRFSSRRQEAGDSIRRQDTGARDWAARNKVHLDTLLKVDRGISAFKGQNADLGSLGEFLKLIQSGRVARGAYLVVESLDRLSRDDVQPALRLILGMIAAGIRIVQLTPVEMVYDDKSDAMALIVMIVELSRGNSESKVKSNRVGKAWAEKRKAARESGQVMTHRLPAWIEEKDGKLELIPDRADIVKRIFTLAGAGYGIPSIIATFIREGVPCFGRKGQWTRSYVGIILKDRRATGEIQPRKGKDLDGKPIPDYYPAVVTPEEFHAARAGAAQRKTYRGRLGSKEVNVFAGLLKHARDGDSYQMTQRFSRSPGRPTRRYQALVNRNADEAKGRGYSIPYNVFEQAILTWLEGIDPREVLGTDNKSGNEVVALQNELAALDEEIAVLAAGLKRKATPTLVEAAEQKDEYRAELVARLAEAQARAASPLATAWGEFPTLTKALAIAPDQKDARLRLRASLRRIVESIHLLIVRRLQDHLCAVQVCFASGQARRTYFVLHRPASGSRPPDPRAGSISSLDPQHGTDLVGLDLRDPSQVQAMETFLEKVNVEAFRQMLRPLPA
jgi:DNA invertase Pin-like site-specific DNA recombinase